MTTELVVPDKIESASSQLITIEPKKYVELVFAPFKTKLAAAIEADAEVKFDITTTAGMAIAVKRRAVFRDEIRIATEAARKERKAPILEIGKLLDEGAKKIFAQAEPYESKYDDLITAEIRRKEAIKIEQRRLEEERQAKIQAAIDDIKGAAVRVAGKSSAEIDKASVELDFLEVAYDEFGDRTGEASLAKSSTLQKLADMHDEALAREKEALRVAAQIEADRIERERVAEANRVESERLAKLAREIEERDAAARAEQEKKDQEAAAARAAADKDAADRRAEQDRIAEANRVAAQKILDDQSAALRAQQEAADKIAREAREAEEKKAADARAEEERVAREAREAEEKKAADARAEEERVAREAREEEQRRIDTEEAERRRVEQEAADAARAAEEAKHAADRKLRDAAPALLAAAQEALAVIKKLKPPANGNGTIVRLEAAIAAATV